jgi:hypothetical protein
MQGETEKYFSSQNEVDQSSAPNAAFLLNPCKVK